MNRREFLTSAGGISAAALMANPALPANAAIPPIVRGLVIVSFEDATKLRLGFPRAKGHTATFSVKTQTGSSRVEGIKGRGVLDTTQPQPADYKLAAPELIRMRELYGDGVRSRVDQCPTVIEIPYAAIRSISSHEVSAARYTFLRRDTGKEVTTFRPRQVTESIRIDLMAPGSMKLENGKKIIPLDTTKEIRAEFLPESTAASSSADLFTDHFHHYLMYLDRPASAGFDVVPKKLGASASVSTPVARYIIPPFIPCFLVAVP